MDANILEELEERAAIIEHDGNKPHYEAAQAACRCITTRHGEALRPTLLVWLKGEKDASKQA